jgi:NADH-quinone oxidoreductase subunit M
MISVLLILIPLITGLAAFFIKNEKTVRAGVLFSAIITLVISLLGLTVFNNEQFLQFTASWLGSFRSSFSLKLDGMGQVLCLLTAIAYPLVFVSTWRTVYKNAHNFFAWMMLAQAGLMGVFLAMDALLFYFFWELALIPMYFLCSQWGGERRIPVTFKFFIYTFVGSVLMLIAILVIYSHTRDRSFAIESFYNAQLPADKQSLLFWLFFAAVAIKIPVFPFHTWQPDTYEQSPAATTMILSGVMVKMGVFALLRWTLPVMPLASYAWGDTIMSMAVIGMIYASLIAFRQDDIKRLIAYSSIAHMGLMCLAVFAEHKTGIQGVMIQMFNHGINIIGLWIVAELIERQLGTRKISELGGLAQKAPALAILFVTIVLANIALPLTNAFVGEFMMLSGIYSSGVTAYYLVFTVLAGICIILAAVYMLTMVRKTFFGNTNELTAGAADITMNEKLALAVIVVIIFWLGIYPDTLLHITNDVSENILIQSDVNLLIQKK